MYLSRSDDRPVGPARLHIALIGGGVLTALVTGLLGYAGSSFLEPLYGSVAGIKLSTSLLFDVGVYAAVLGLVLVAIDTLGGPPPDETADPPAHPREPKEPTMAEEGIA